MRKIAVVFSAMIVMGVAVPATAATPHDVIGRRHCDALVFANTLSPVKPVHCRHRKAHDTLVYASNGQPVR